MAYVGRSIEVLKFHLECQTASDWLSRAQSRSKCAIDGVRERIENRERRKVELDLH